MREFKTLIGAQRRCAFENAHSIKYKFRIVRSYEGVIDKEPFDKAKASKYTYRLAWERRNHGAA